MAKGTNLNNPLRRRRRVRGGPGRPKDERPLTLAQLAAATGYGPSYTTEIELGRKRASDDYCEALARFYGVEMEVVREEADSVWKRAQKKK